MDTRTLVSALSWASEWYPNSEAFIQAERELRLTYVEVEEAARGVATILADAGVGASDRVAFLCRTTVEHAIGFFGVQMLGGIPVTLHVRESPGVLRDLADHIDPAVLVYQSEFRDEAKSLQDDPVNRILELGQLDDASNRGGDCSLIDRACMVDKSVPDVDVLPEDVAFIALSSGTTGRPKGVVHTHEEAIEGAHLGQYKLGVQNHGTYLVQATPSFIGWAMLLFPIVNTAATAVFLERWDPERVLWIVDRESLDLLLLVSTQWRQVLQADPAQFDTSSVRNAIYTGEPIGKNRLKEIRSNVCERVYTVYSSTEALNVGTALFPEQVTQETLGSVGRPVPNTDLRLVNPDSRDPDDRVDRGEIGEVVMRGPSVASQLWDSDRVDDPFHEDGWWFSGDLAHVGDDGNLYLVGRSDNMIISGGIKIYPEYVEKVLEENPHLEEAAVIGMPDDQWGERVTAFVVADDDFSADSLDEWCLNHENLSNYQRPREYKSVSDLPRTNTGKLDRTSLIETE